MSVFIGIIAVSGTIMYHVQKLEDFRPLCVRQISRPAAHECYYPVNCLEGSFGNPGGYSAAEIRRWSRDCEQMLFCRLKFSSHSMARIGLIGTDASSAPANFYVLDCEGALARLNVKLPLNTSHVFLGSNAPNVESYFEGVNEKLEKFRRLGADSVSFIVSAPREGVLSFFGTLEKLHSSFVVIVPVVDDLHYWYQLRNWNEKYQFVLMVNESVLDNLMLRYKCLKYSAVHVGNGNTKLAQYLLTKLSKPDIVAFEMSPQIRAIAESGAIKPHSDKLIEPLQPLTQNMALDVYRNFEKDSVKYTQYDAAIELAMQDLRLKNARLRILVIGPGRGPLLESVVRYSVEDDVVVAVEKNPICISTLESKNTSSWNNRVQLIEGDVRQVLEGSYNLIVSELLGSFGCNEACPEILKTFTDTSTVMIPLEYRSYVQPIFSHTLANLDRPYIAFLNSYYTVAEPKQVFEFCHPAPNAFELEKMLLFEFSELDTINAFQGYFEADLYGPFRIGILPGLHQHEFCDSWYPMVFPVEPVTSPVTVKFSRKCEGSRFWYEWAVDGKCMNKDGGKYSINL